MIDKIKSKYDSVVELYIVTFKNIYFKNTEVEDYWVNGCVGGVLHINGYEFDFNTIKYAVDNRVKTEWLFVWYKSESNLKLNDWWPVCLNNIKSKYKYGRL